MTFRTRVAYPVLLAAGTTIATGLGAAIVSKFTDGSIARLFGGLTVRQIQSADTQFGNEDTPLGQGVPLGTPFKCKGDDFVLLSCLTYLHPNTERICDSVVRDDGKGGVCRVGTCEEVRGQRWRVTLTCLKR